MYPLHCFSCEVDSVILSPFWMCPKLSALLSSVVLTFVSLTIFPLVSHLVKYSSRLVFVIVPRTIFVKMKVTPPDDTTGEKKVRSEE